MEFFILYMWQACLSREIEGDMAINCLRVLSKFQLSTKPKSPKPYHSLPLPLSLCRREESLSLGGVAVAVAGLSHSSSMSYDKELHAAKKAASLAATLCQAFLLLFLFLLNLLLHDGIFLFCIWVYIGIIV